MYDQLSLKLLQMYGSDKKILLIESLEEFRRYPHHKKKLVFFIAAMRNFYEQYKDQYNIEYIKTNDSIAKVLIDYSNVCVVEPNEWGHLQHFTEMRYKILPDIRFLCPLDEFKDFAQGKKRLLMENFYHLMRRKTGFLMRDDKPVGGKWNFDHDNRLPAPEGLKMPKMLEFPRNKFIEDVIQEVEENFHTNFGDIHPFWLATNNSDAWRAVEHFIKTGLENFGTYQDAMQTDQAFLFHSGISAYLNIGLLDPHEVCEAVIKSNARIESIEAFIRQIIGWREFVRGVYWLYMPDYINSNYLNHKNHLPDFYWTAQTDMNCLRECIKTTKEMAYSHHIQRLMVTGNFANLIKVNPMELHNWYLAVYADAHPWVEIPNTIGMALYADGGIVGTKPYVSGQNYIKRMSNFCNGCKYEKQCPFQYLYWNFIISHYEQLKTNPRMQIPIKNVDRMSEEKKREIIEISEKFIRSILTK